MNTKMLEETAKEYSNYMKIDLDKKLAPINSAVDEMLARLEEFETMISLVEQERCSAIGVAGTLTEVMDKSSEFSTLCERIDTLEKVIEHINSNIDYLENKLEAAENSVGLNNNTNKLKTFLKPLLKLNMEQDKTEQQNTAGDALFKTEHYFLSTGDN